MQGIIGAGADANFWIHEELLAKNPGKDIHVVLDNLNTHKPKQDRWLKAAAHCREPALLALKC